MLELIERDQVAIWWYNRLEVPGVDLDSVEDTWLSQVRDHIASQKRQFWVLDLTADLGIPVAAAFVASPDGSAVGMGFGAHLDLRSAVIRAATELVQLGLGAPSGGLGSGADHVLHLAHHTYLRPDADSPARSCPPDAGAASDIREALGRCRAAIETQGIELLVLDQTRPDIGLPVVKVLAPGLRHFWPRFGPGRLYEVPVRLGRIEHPREERELNPLPPVA
jgi:ribosomal protein S12 methylthiotransferase accessory factor